MRKAQVSLVAVLIAVGLALGFVSGLNAQTLPADLVAAYGFNEGSGNTAADATGNSNTGTIFGATWTPSGRYGNALSFNGSSSRVDIIDSNSVDLTSGMTLEAWVYPTSLSGWRTVVLKEISGGLSYALYAHDNAPQPAAYINTGGSDLPVAGTASIPINTWTHLAATYDGTSFSLFVNGSNVGTSTSIGAIRTSTSPLRIGGNAIWGEYFSGRIDEVRIYNRALSQSEIQTDMNTSIVILPTDITPPTTPSNLASTAAGSSQIDLSWTASTDNIGVTGYQIERCQGSGCSTFTQIAVTTTTTYNNTGLQASTRYRYRIRATDAANNLSPYSSIAAASTQQASDITPPTTPSNLTATAANSSQIDLSWTASTDNIGVTGYQIERCQGSGCSAFTQIAVATTTTYSNTGLQASTRYRYRIRAMDGANNLSPYSSTAAARTQQASDTTPPTAPANLFASAVGSGQVNLSWTASTDNIGVTGYQIERCQGSGCSTFTQIAAPTTTTYTNIGLQASTTYRYRARATDAANNLSPYSNTLSITTAASSGSQNAAILIISSAANPFSGYYAEILRAEGFNTFAVNDISSVSSTVLASYDVVIVGDISLTSSQVTMLTNWVNAGGNLISMRPDKKLASLLGLIDLSSTISDAYLLINTSTGPGVGIVDQTIQYHGTADIYGLDGASILATLYSDANTSTSEPAVTLHSAGSGQAAAFTYDLARSVVYTRQGNPAWAGEERDGSSPIRSDDLFYPDWVDFNKVAIPQADEQQRLLANLIIQMNVNNKPLPRFWYFPWGLPAVVVMTGDDHSGTGGTEGRFDDQDALSDPGCSVENWECIRSTSYIYPDNSLANSQAAAYDSMGFEVALHVSTYCDNWTLTSLATFYTDQLSQWHSAYPGLPSPLTNRTHCIAWSDYVTQPQVELANGIRLDTNYYYWPSSWVNDRPGFFTGSGMPMRFAKSDGTIIDVYQAVTQMTDESGQAYPYTIDALLDKAIGPEGYYGAFTANMHTDSVASSDSDAIVSSAVARDIPVISARQMLVWLDGRNASTFSSLNWNGNILDFTISVGEGANNLMAMAPVPYGQTVTSVTHNGSSISFAMVAVKGIQYASFLALNGDYQVSYVSDTTPPMVSGISPSSGASGVSTGTKVTAIFSELMDPATINAGTFELRGPANTLVASTVTYDAAAQTAMLSPSVPLANSATYTATIQGGTNGVKDFIGNPMTTAFSWSFTTAAVSAEVSTIWPDTTIPGIVDPGPDNAVELGVKFRADVSGYVSGIRFYKATANTGAHVGNLWTSAGTLLARANFTNETASGWQQVNFSPPVAVVSNTVYVASYHTTVGHYSVDLNYFSGNGVDSPPLRALADGESGFNGVYAYGSNSSFPNSGYNSSNYWVDIAFSATEPPLATLTSIAVTPVNQTILMGAMQQFTATGTYSDSSTKDLTNQTTWTSTNTSVATIASSGLATAINPGSTTIMATLAGITGSTNLTVQAITDTTPPIVTAFTIPATTSSLTVAISSFIATDNVGVTGYMVNELSLAPLATAAGWSSTAPASHTFTTAGNKTLYAWAKDAAGNVSASRSANVLITLPTTEVEPAGWYTGDMHVHRSCGGSPEAVSTIFQMMSAQNLSVVSLLADMGNGEVQDPDTDLPLVTGQDASVSTSDQILHWDAEWHWDAVYTQYPNQALGGHVVALGVTEAHQIWEEYTYPIFNWAHQQNGIAGFAHMQYLDNDIPQTLDCCTPIEYPVEVALGSADFIAEDMNGSDSFIQAYYRLLNCGFRPGFGAGSDYPCAVNELGSLLTYAQVEGGQLTYRNWIEGMAAGRTVVSRNGHNEFLSLIVNNSSTPGDEINLATAGSVPVAITWTANQNLSGTIELVQNGIVIASTPASVASGVPASLSATADFASSGWLAARRMDGNGHVVHTAAVFVTINNAPVRASVEDAEFYVQWMDKLLTETSPGGEWISYFPTSLSQARARYQAAKEIYQQIAVEAGGQATTLSISTTSLPGGTTAVPYSASLAASGGTSPYTWSISSGLLPTGLTLNGLTGVISGSPIASGTYSFTVQAVDSSNPQQIATKALNISVTTQASFTLWSNTTIPAVIDAGPDSAVELGVKFRSDASGDITGIRFYKAGTNTGTHVANLWTDTGTLLATATFVNETASGWQQVNFTPPVAISANTVYVASYHTSAGHYSDDQYYFTGAGVDNPPLHAPADGVSGFNGVYAYGSTSSFPNYGWRSSNYWVDVVFQP
jgi:hypothetical protein